MLICPDCEKELKKREGGAACERCEKTYPVSGGIYEFYDSRERADEYYHEDFFEVDYEKSANFFWYTARNETILRLFKKYADPDGRILEIGCGGGRMLEILGGNGFRAEGCDIYATALRLAARKFKTVYYQANLLRLPFEKEFQAIGIFDVLEHIDDDAKALSNIHRALTDGGLLFLTVPAKEKLRSKYDDLLRHKRRYELAQLKSLLANSGFGTLKISYNFFLTYPLIYFDRMYLQKKKDYTDTEEDNRRKELDFNPFVNRFFGVVCGVEARLVPLVNLPTGSSLIAVARKIG